MSGYSLSRLRLSARVKAPATHQAMDGSGEAATMTTGVQPHCETVTLTAPGFVRPNEPRHPDNAGTTNPETRR